ncbi:hypothetical protein EV421DRAFT_1737807 [Armillaria borealis]|uniref:Uncharacterized protein n=1 Tax=Armillaria borealis TaxID=47425 RepID=A0AA39JFJ9_9AGAR|nr:hypothetical protein EV421DRAFT_1737807 [Armillaria borealis]
MEKVAWLHFGNADVLCSRDTSCPVVVSLVGMAVAGKWYNKLSGLGDFDKRYPKGPAKLKWLLYIKSPSVQQRVSTGQPRDMLVQKRSGTELQLTANMFKRRNVSDPMDNVTRNYKVPSNFSQAYQDFIVNYGIDPIDIQDCHGDTIAMGEEAENAVGGSLCLLTFEIKHYRIDTVNTESFNAVLKSIRILVPNKAVSEDQSKQCKKMAALRCRRRISLIPPGKLKKEGEVEEARLKGEQVEGSGERSHSEDIASFVHTERQDDDIGAAAEKAEQKGEARNETVVDTIKTENNNAGKGKDEEPSAEESVGDGILNRKWKADEMS